MRQEVGAARSGGTGHVDWFRCGVSTLERRNQEDRGWALLYAKHLVPEKQGCLMILYGLSHDCNTLFALVDMQQEFTLTLYP